MKELPGRECGTLSSVRRRSCWKWSNAWALPSCFREMNTGLERVIELTKEILDYNVHYSCSPQLDSKAREILSIADRLVEQSDS